MRSISIVLCLTLGVVAGCSSQTPPFVDHVGQAKSETSYPPGPYGVGVGSTIANFDFVGFGNAKANNSAMQMISLADFYTPHAFDATYTPASAAEDDRLFPADSGYPGAGNPKPTVLLIDVASVWCGPCNDEAENVFPQKHVLYAPCGGEFLLDLHDGITPGTAATPQSLRTWTTHYKVDFPSAIDPAYKLDPLFSADAFPNNMIIDTTTMKIVDITAGEVVPGTCSDVLVCSSDADCVACIIPSGGTAGTCASGSACTVDADCQAEKCTPSKFWTEFEAHLDKGRAGCTLH